MPAYYLEIAVVGIGLALLITDAFRSGNRRRELAWTGAAGLIAVFVATFFVDTSGSATGVFWSFYSADASAMFYKQIALLCTIIVLVMSVEYSAVLRKFTSGSDEGAAGLGEFYCLPLFACAGLMWMASATDLISIFVALELVTMSFYVLVAYMRRNVGSLEAGVKYLILGALSTGFFVYGITWIYGLTGQTNLDKIAAYLATSGDLPVTPLLFGFTLMLVGLGFKVGAVPFQIWIPDVYQGAPTPITAFLSVGSKAAGFIVLLRVTEPFLGSSTLASHIILPLLIIAGATIIYGNLAAIPQTNLKRLLAFSSISHAGFLLMAIACSPETAQDLTPAKAVSFYLGTYLIMTLLCFLIITVIRARLEGEDLSSLNGLSQRSPFLAFAMLIGVASLAGIPLTAGFFGKFFVFQLAVSEERFVLLAIATIGAAAGFYYYFKIIRSMYWNQPEGKDLIYISLPAKATIAVLAAAVIFFGVYPAPILNLLG